MFGCVKRSLNLGGVIRPLGRTEGVSMGRVCGAGCRPSAWAYDPSLDALTSQVEIFLFLPFDFILRMRSVYNIMFYII